MRGCVSCTHRLLPRLPWNAFAGAVRLPHTCPPLPFHIRTHFAARGFMTCITPWCLRSRRFAAAHKTLGFITDMRFTARLPLVWRKMRRCWDVVFTSLCDVACSTTVRSYRTVCVPSCRVPRRRTVSACRCLHRATAALIMTYTCS